MRVLHALVRRHRGLKPAGKMPVRKETRTVKGEAVVTYRAFAPVMLLCCYGFAIVLLWFGIGFAMLSVFFLHGFACFALCL